MSKNPDPIYDRCANLDFSGAKPAPDVPPLAKLQLERGSTSAVK